MYVCGDVCVGVGMCVCEGCVRDVCEGVYVGDVCEGCVGCV